MQGRPHQADADGLARSDEVTQSVRVEPLDPAPEPDVGIGRLLGLHPHEVLDDIGDRPVHPLEEHLCCPSSVRLSVRRVRSGAVVVRTIVSR